MASSAGTDSGVKPLQTAMKMAKTAIHLDGDSRRKEAYCEYLRTINYISHALLEEAESQKEREVPVSVAEVEVEMVVEVEVERMLTLAEQCLERAQSFVKGGADPPEPPASSSCPPARPESRQATVAPADVAATTAASPVAAAAAAHRRVMSDGDGDPSSPFLPPEVFQRLQIHESCDTNRKELTPIEEASRLNQKLKANFEARLARLAPGQKYQKTSLKLSLQRQMMENLIIAKARQDALQRKMEERRQRLQEEANRRFAASGSTTAEEQEQRTLYTNVLEYEQDHDWPKLWKATLKQNPDDATLVSRLVSYLLSRSDHPVAKLLKKHQYRVYNRIYPIISKGLGQSPRSPARRRLRESHSDHSLLHPETPRRTTSTGSSNMGTVFSSSPSHHDFHTTCEDDGDDDDVDVGEESRAQALADRDNSFEDLEQFLTHLDWSAAEDDVVSEPSGDPLLLNQGHVQELEMRALKEHLKATVKDIHIAIDQLLSLCLLSFECLNSAASKDLCLATLEESFFAPLWSALVVMFRKVNIEREQAFHSSMTLYSNASPGDLGVPSKLYTTEPGTVQSSYTYECAVQELKLLVNDSCPQKKLECIVRTLRMICACAEEYRSVHEGDSAPKTAAIGADDLLPILSFVALKSQCPQLVSECAALEEFIHEGFLIGEEGYCLTSLQSALAYVESLHSAAAQVPPDKLT